MHTIDCRNETKRIESNLISIFVKVILKISTTTTTTTTTIPPLTNLDQRFSL